MDMYVPPSSSCNADPSVRAGPNELIPLELGVHIMRDCAVALHDLHAGGVVMEDLKPANVLLQIDHAGGPKLS